MKAGINTRYGGPDVVEVRSAPKPEPKENELLVKVHATTVNRTDCGMRTPYPFFIRAFIGLRSPKLNILGLDFAGEVESVGSKVSTFKPGDRVFGLSPDTCGAHAEYLCAPEDGPIASMPAGASFEEGAPIEGAWYASLILKAFGLKPGHKILIYGATGAIGTAAVQLAKSYGSTVTAVCAGRHVGLVESIGADRVIDYEAQDFTAIGETFDYVLDAVGKSSYFSCRRLLKPSGVFSATDLGPWGQVALLSIWSSIVRSGRVIFPLPRASKEFIEFLRARIEAGLYRAVIDRRYALDEIVEAYRYVETGQKVGNVVIKVTSSD
ncbi:NAD(P)-dependent alcohol dehydrogenase [Candidatus Eisenbacteria bacterium]|uniref:NAD(P)-dependent alcohol dehydrogenase n=1 Tax=Eiseniibacteriota bacterium TaxID=2212470 RepID=A0ABV6YKP6_UNCEI